LGEGRGEGRTLKLSRELWQQIEPLLTTALELEAGARAAWLRGLDATHPEATPVLRRMLEAHERAESRGDLETVPRLAPGPGWSSTHAPGARIGPFELVRPIGRGGMGEVWLARQADGRVARDVALKLPALHQQGDTWRERFRRERDILAKLEHPHIARLYDAGITEAGQPWLAMEFVAGASLSDYVASRSLSIPQRLALFRQVLAAVGHAHRHLVVHRDLKPPNILVDASDQVKLLDFGIAKLVDDADAAGDAGELTRLGGRVMTRRYAAPEQVAAGAITTATDIYALGVILHEVLTGLSPYRAVREGKPLTDVMLLQEEPGAPSTLGIPKAVARLVSGDLDAIILKAMRRAPADRYASVELLDEDILAHLQKRPVKARAGTWRYLAGRFAVRHKLPFATAAAVLVTLLAGLVVADRERRVAVAEKARAERHLASVRKLANTMIFDVHAQIENLPGSLMARETLIGTSLEYLNALAGEAGNDPALLYELATAYRNIGNIQGQAGGANTGNLVAAVGNFEKARSLFAAADAARPNHAATLRDLSKLSYALAKSYWILSDPRWRQEITAAIALAERVAALPGATLGDRSFVAFALGDKAHLTSVLSGLTPEVEATLKQAIAILEPMVREAPGQVELREALVGAYTRLGSALSNTGRTARSLREGIVYARKSRDLARALSAEFPNDGRKQGYLWRATHELARMLSLIGEHREADRTIAEAIALSAMLAARDPANMTVAIDRVHTLSQAALIAYRLGDQPRAIARGREAVAFAEKLPLETRKSRDVRARIAEANAFLGYGLFAASREVGERERQLALLREGCPLLAGGVAFMAEFRALKQGSVPEDDVKAMTDATNRCNEALARLGGDSPPIDTIHPPIPAFRPNPLAPRPGPD
jgi:eukaryotic-like serine/threonine-protein kinase